jgi:hypothetical protein
MEAVEEQARLVGASRVLAINLVVGDRASFIDDLLLYYFVHLSPGTLAEGAQLNVRRIPMQIYKPVKYPEIFAVSVVRSLIPTEAQRSQSFHIFRFKPF